MRIVIEREGRQRVVLFDTWAIRKPFRWLAAKILAVGARRDFRRRERAALPDGTRVRLLCPPDCAERHAGVYTTLWTPRRVWFGRPNARPWDEPDDYYLTRESDGETHYATRDAIEVVSEAGRPAA